MKISMELNDGHSDKNVPPLSPPHPPLSKFSGSPTQSVLVVKFKSFIKGQLEALRHSWLTAHKLSSDLTKYRDTSPPHPLTTNRFPFGHGTFSSGRRAILIFLPGTISSFKTMTAMSYARLTKFRSKSVFDRFPSNQKGQHVTENRHFEIIFTLFGDN